MGNNIRCFIKLFIRSKVYSTFDTINSGYIRTVNVRVASLNQCVGIIGAETNAYNNLTIKYYL